MRDSLLSSTMVEKGIEECIMNAKEKFSSANLLFGKGNYSSAISLYIIALQEIGKITIIINISKFNKDETDKVKSFWKAFRDHNVKDFFGTFRLIQQKSNDSFNNLAHSYLEWLLCISEEYPEDIRLKSLYVDYIDNEWVRPQYKVSKAQIFKKLLTKLLNDIDTMTACGFHSKKYIEAYKNFYQEELKFFNTTNYNGIDDTLNNMNTNQIKERMQNFILMQVNNNIITLPKEGLIMFGNKLNILS